MLKKQQGYVLLSAWLLLTAMMFSVMLATDVWFVQQRVSQVQMDRLNAFFLADNVLYARLLSLREGKAFNGSSVFDNNYSQQVSVNAIKNTACFQSVVAIHVKAQYHKAHVSLLAWQGVPKKLQSKTCELPKSESRQLILWKEVYT